MFSKARTKAVLMNKSIPDMGSSEIVTDVIYTEIRFPELLNQLDRSEFHFCQVNRSCYVNLRYNNLANNEVVTDKIANRLFDQYSHLKLAKKHEEEFVSKKNAYQHSSSLQKDQFRYILNFIINALSSFTKN
jgi:hypothetical protein